MARSGGVGKVPPLVVPLPKVAVEAASPRSARALKASPRSALRAQGGGDSAAAAAGKGSKEEGGGGGLTSRSAHRWLVERLHDMRDRQTDLDLFGKPVQGCPTPPALSRQRSAISVDHVSPAAPHDHTPRGNTSPRPSGDRAVHTGGEGAGGVDSR